MKTRGPRDVPLPSFESNAGKDGFVLIFNAVFNAGLMRFAFRLNARAFL